MNIKIKIKIISCNEVSEMWYADHINETFKVKKEYKDYYQLYYQQRIVFKEDAIKRMPTINYHNKIAI
ncbi:MAG TPA: hypothetical protein EYG89_02555 [Bacteroidia bacterium]|nr:hypothetical protein [Bacteroidia bacterium]